MERDITLLMDASLAKWSTPSLPSKPDCQPTLLLIPPLLISLGHWDVNVCNFVSAVDLCSL